MGDLRFRMTAPKGLRLQFAQSRSSSLPSLPSRKKPRREIKSIALLRPIFVDLQQKSATSDDADESLLSQKQHRCRPPRGIQHWFEAFDEYLLDSDSDESNHDDWDRSPRKRWDIPSPRTSSPIQSDVSRDDGSAYGAHPLRSNPTSEKGESPPYLRASTAHIGSYFNVSSPSLPASSLPQTADYVKDNFFAPSLLQTDNESEIALVDEAKVQTYRLFPQSRNSRFHEPGAQREFPEKSHPEVTSGTSSYLLPNHSSTNGQFMPDLQLAPISPLKCRFSRIMSQGEVEAESVLLTRRQRQLSHLDLDGARTATD